MNRLGIGLLGFLYVGYFLILTLTPFQFVADAASLIRGMEGLYRWSNAQDFFANVVFFIPFGALLYCWQVTERQKISALVFVMVIGAMTSVSVEVSQLFFSRHSSLFDVLSNSLGTGIGALALAATPRRLADLPFRLCMSATKWPSVVCSAVLFGAVPFILSVTQFLAPFALWNSRFTLQMGNEATLDRPWRGKIHLVALYNRALGDNEVERNFIEGFAPQNPSRSSKKGLIALYTFSEAQGRTIGDRSHFGKPLDLNVPTDGHIRWLDTQGIEIVKPSIIRSHEPANKVIDAMRETEELTIEAWVTPHDAVQSGPAIIASLSRDNDSRNFTLGQEGAAVDFRLRTPVTGLNGYPLSLMTTDVVSAAKVTHLVASYKSGVQRLFVDGVKQSKTLNLTSDGVIGLAIPKSVAARIAYSFFYFVPVSALIAGFLSTRLRHRTKILGVPIVVTTGLLGLTETCQAFLFHRTIDLQLIVWGTITAILGAYIGRLFVSLEGVQGREARFALS